MWKPKVKLKCRTSDFDHRCETESSRTFLSPHLPTCTDVPNTIWYLTGAMQMNEHWPLIIFGNLTDVSVHNAFAIWTAFFPSGTWWMLHWMLTTIGGCWERCMCLHIVLIKYLVPEESVFCFFAPKCGLSIGSINGSQLMSFLIRLGKDTLKWLENQNLSFIHSFIQDYIKKSSAPCIFDLAVNLRSPTRWSQNWQTQITYLLDKWIPSELNPNIQI